MTFDVAKTGYEPDSVWNLRSLVMDKDWAVDARLQPIYLVAEASSLSATLDPGDRGAFVGEPYESDYCAPCKIFRLRTDSSSKIAIQLSWIGDAGLTLWALGGSIRARSASGTSEISVTISTVGGIESKIYVGLPSPNWQVQTLHTAVPFELTTSAP